VAHRIVVIEDDGDIARLLTLELSEAGYEVHAFENGVRGLTAVRTLRPDLVILDLGLPDLAGVEIARRVRVNEAIPILVLTAADAIATKVELLGAGADDYLVKPFHMEELLARVAVQLRRNNVGAPRQVGDVTIDPVKRQVMVQGREVKLSPRELGLLVFLSAQPGRVYSREEIERHVWEGEAVAPNSNVVDVHMANLRNKLRDAGAFGLIRTVRGAGYALKD
jgi:two-component system alkaline phosphatase synthesis response regulator PhoP